jgi:2-iminobutanoate/2-iminopropanoate deaminase
VQRSFSRIIFLKKSKKGDLLMTTQILHTSLAPAAIGPYSQGISTGPFVFVSGQIGIDPETGELIGPDFAAQARRSLENLRQIVLSGGCELSHVVAVDVFLTDIDDFAEFNKIYEEFFSEHRPARAVVQVCALPKGALIELKCIAQRDVC